MPFREDEVQAIGPCNINATSSGESPVALGRLSGSKKPGRVRDKFAGGPVDDSSDSCEERSRQDYEEAAPIINHATLPKKEEERRLQ